MRNDQRVMANYIMGYRISQIVHAAAVFSLADHAARGPIVPESLALEEGLNLDACHRFLHACTSIDLLSHQAGTFVGTTLLATLSSDGSSLRGLALSLPGPGFWSPWGLFTTALRTGENQASATLGSSVFEYYVDHPKEADGFASTLRYETDALVRTIIDTLDTTGLEIIADLGGSSGVLVDAFLSANADLRAILFDLPAVIDRARASGVSSDRLAYVAGDFFACVPPADLYLLKHVLHDWNDAECLKFLKNCRASIGVRGKIAIVELAVNDDFSGNGPLMDMTMLVAFTGRERTAGNYGLLLAAAGFAIVAVTPIGDGYILIEATPA